MDKFAVIKTGGKQYTVRAGAEYRFEKLALEPGAVVSFETLLTADDEAREVRVGTPVLGEIVNGEVIAHGLGEKKIGVKFKNKIRYTRTKNHRQPYTAVRITKIG